MEHPGVKSLLDRIMKTQTKSTAGKKEKPVEICLDFDDSGKKLVPDCAKLNSFSRLAEFKENLRMRMKARRVQIRKEEEEDEKIDEEYHLMKEESEDDSDVEDDKKAKKKTISDESDEEDEEGEEKSDDDELKLNLDEEEEDEGDESKQQRKKDCYDFDDEDEDEGLPKLNFKSKDASINEIPLTNSIPSNQLTKSGSLNKADDEQLLFQDEDRSFLDTQFAKQRRSLDELANISFSSEMPNSTAPQQMPPPNPSDENAFCTQNEGLFDELAILCSGQFKQSSAREKASTDLSGLMDEGDSGALTTQQANFLFGLQESEEDKSLKDLQCKNREEKKKNDEDLYAEDDEEEFDEATRNKLLGQELESEESNEAKLDQQGQKFKETEVVESETEEEEEEDEKIEEVNKKVEKPKRKVREEEENETEIVEDRDKVIEEDFDVEELEEAKKKNKSDEERDDFFDEEAELSGSEAESDEDYDGEPDDEDKQILFSGDEDQLPSDSELKQQLGKIYLKDQIDEDKRQLRLFKEMYLKDGEFHGEKELRKKQFRWKNMNENWKETNPFSSDEEDEEEDDGEEEKDAEKKNKDTEKKNKYMKLMASRNWRLIRHEREQYVHAKLKSDSNTLLSDDEKNDRNSAEESDNDEDEEDETVKSSFTSSTSTAVSNNKLLKKGHELLKQSLLRKCEQNKRSIDGEVSTVVNSVLRTSHHKPIGSSISFSPFSASSISIRQINKQPSTTTTNNNNNNNKPSEVDEDSNFMKKFSFLNRDKSYLNRLSSYVSKNVFTGEVGSFKNKNRNMVFTTLDIENNEDVVNGQEKSQVVSVVTQSKKAPSSNFENKSLKESNSIVSLPANKKAKYDTCESIFNHI